MTYVISPPPLFHASDAVGAPYVGALLFTYAAGTSTKQVTYNASGGSANTDPIVLDASGDAPVWLDPTLVYKLVLAPPGDTDPPTNPIWTVDNLFGIGNVVNVNTVATISALRAYNVVAAPGTLTVQGYASTADGGEGIFELNVGDITSADNGGTIIVDALGRRWYRIYAGLLDPYWFGAKGDGTTDDSGPLAAADNAAVAAKSGLMINATHNVATNLTLSSVPFFQGGSLVLNASVTIQKGIIAAENMQIFSGTGALALNGQRGFVYPEWCGAQAGGGDAGPAARKLITALGSAGGVLYFGPGTYSFNISAADAMVITTPVSVQGAGRGVTLLEPLQDAAFSIINQQEQSFLRDFTISNGTLTTNASWTAITIDSGLAGLTANVHVLGAYTGIRGINANNYTVETVRLQNCARCLWTGGVSEKYWGDSDLSEVILIPAVNGDRTQGIGLLADNGSNAMYNRRVQTIEGQYGVVIQSSVAETSDWVRPEGLWFWDCNLDAAVAANVEFTGGRSVHFYDSDITGSISGPGVNMVSSDGSDPTLCDGLELQDCYIVANALDGVFMNNSGNLTLDGGQCRGNSSSAASTYNGVTAGATAYGFLKIVNVQMSQIDWGGGGGGTQDYCVSLASGSFTTIAGFDGLIHISNNEMLGPNSGISDASAPSGSSKLIANNMQP